MPVHHLAFVCLLSDFANFNVDDPECVCVCVCDPQLAVWYHVRRNRRPPWWKPRAIKSSACYKTSLAWIMTLVSLLLWLAFLIHSTFFFFYQTACPILNCGMCREQWIGVFTCGRSSNTFCFALVVSLWPERLTGHETSSAFLSVVKWKQIYKPSPSSFHWTYFQWFFYTILSWHFCASGRTGNLLSPPDVADLEFLNAPPRLVRSINHAWIFSMQTLDLCERRLFWVCLRCFNVSLVLSITGGDLARDSRTKKIKKEKEKGSREPVFPLTDQWLQCTVII